MNITNPQSLPAKLQKQIALSLLLLPTHGITASAAITLASWDIWTDTTNEYTADTTLSGFSATISQVDSSSNRIHASFGSDDGTFGSTLSGADTSGSALLVAAAYTDTLLITLENNSGQNYQIDSFHFDFAPRETGNDIDYGFNAFDLTYTSGGLGKTNTLIDSQSGLDYVVQNFSNAISNYPDYDFNLADDLTDLELADGESATFTLVFSGNVGATNVSSILDNVTFQGTVIPETASAALLTSLCTGILLVRRRRRA